MSWRGEVGGVEAARHGHDVVMSPGPVLYFDFAQSDLADEPPSRWVPRTQPLAKVYAYDPVPAELTVDEAKHILGVQGNIWTEQMRQEKTVVHAAFPRVAALSELAWSAPEKKDFDSFLKRLTHQLPRYEGLGVAYADSAFQVDVKAEKDPATGGVLVSMASQTGLGEIRYTLDGTDPTVNSPAYTEALKLRLPVTVKAKSFLEGVPLAATTKATYDAATLARREDTDLETCTSGLVIKLEDDDPAKGDRTNFVVDILNPCWIYKGADLTDVVSIEAKIGQLPFNFRLGNYSKKVELPSPVSEHGELRVRLDTCDGEIIAELPVPTSEPRLGLHKVSGSMRPVDGTHDLCLQFTGNKMDPYWAIDWIDLVTGPSAE
jgi:hexosaminidase